MKFNIFRLLVIFTIIFPISLLAQYEEQSPSFSRFEKKFLTGEATRIDAEGVIKNLFSEIDSEILKGLYFCRFVHPRFIEFQNSIERKLLSMLNDKGSLRHIQAVETSYSIAFSKDIAEQISFVDNEGEANLIRAIIKEKSGALCKPTAESLITTLDGTNFTSGGHLVDAKSLLGALKEMNSFKRIIDVSISMNYFGIASRFARTIISHPEQFSKSTVQYATDIQIQLNGK